MWSAILSALSALASLFGQLASVYSAAKERQAGTQAAQNADLTKALSDASKSQTIENDVSVLSDSAALDQLQQYRRD